MTPEELQQILAELGLSQASAARRLSEETGSRYARQHVHRWISGARPVPGTVAALLRAWRRLGTRPAPALVSLEPAPLPEARRLLRQWAHRHGPLRRPTRTDAHVLRAHGAPVAVVMSEIVHPPVAGALYREDAIELARLACADPSWSRVALRLWREAVFPMYRRPWAVSYQDTTIHRGDLYRFDGWVRLARRTRPGRDRRSGRPPGDAKAIWGWSPDPQARARLGGA